MNSFTNKTRNIVSVLLIIASIFILVGCATSNTINKKNKENLTPINGFNTSSLAKPTNKPLSASSTEAGSKGLYFLNHIFQNSSNIFYLDYATNTYRYLCEKLGCTHDNDECTSYINEADNMYSSILYTKNKIVILHDSVIDQNAYAYTANLDGTNRTKLFELADNQELYASNFYANDDYLFFILRTTNIASGEGDFSVVQCNLQTGSLEEGLVLGRDVWELEDIFDNKLYLKKTIYLDTYDDTSTQAQESETVQADSYLENNLDEFYVVDMAQPNLENKIASFNEKYRTAKVYNGMFYEFNATNSTFTKYNFTDKTEQSIVLNPELAQHVVLYNLFDSFWDNNAIITLDNKLYRLDFNQNQIIQTSTLQTQGAEPPFPLTICAEYNDEFCVITNYNEPETSTDGPIITQPTPTYAFILKSDYYQSIPNYRYTLNNT